MLLGKSESKTFSAKTSFEIAFLDESTCTANLVSTGRVWQSFIGGMTTELIITLPELAHLIFNQSGL